MFDLIITHGIFVWICRSTYMYFYMPVFPLLHCIITFDSLSWKQVRFSTNKFSVVKTNFDLSFVLVPSATVPMICWTMIKCDSFLLVYMSYRSTCWPKFISTGIFKALVSQGLSLFIWKCKFMHIWCYFL